MVTRNKRKRKKEAFPYQKRGVWKIHKFKGRALLADEMGLGKTMQALLYAKVFMDEGPIVVICPASVKWNWQREANDIGLHAIVLERMKPPGDVTDLIKVPSKTVYVLNYTILGSVLNEHSWARFLYELNPKLVVIDECHALKNRTTQQSRNVRMFCQGIAKVICLSGTPLTNRPAELWPVLNLLVPKLFPFFKRFATRYCKPEWSPWGPKYTGAQRLPELHEILKEHVMIRRRKKDVLKELPSKTRQVIEVDLSNNREYQTAERDFVRWLMKTHPKKANSARRAERMVRMGYLRRLVGQLKLKAVQEWIKNFLIESSGKLIVFGVHKAVVGKLYEDWKGISVKVDGSVTGRKRQEVIDKFTRHKATRLFFGNITAAGVGWNGQVADTVMFAELGWTPGEHTQAEDRAHRMGQKKPVTCYYLIGKGTIEERIVKLIHEKQKVLDEVLDGKKAMGGFDLADKLEEHLINKRKEKWAQGSKGLKVRSTSGKFPRWFETASTRRAVSEARTCVPF